MATVLGMYDAIAEMGMERDSVKITCNRHWDGTARPTLAYSDLAKEDPSHRR